MAQTASWAPWEENVAQTAPWAPPGIYGRVVGTLYMPPGYLLWLVSTCTPPWPAPCPHEHTGTGGHAANVNISFDNVLDEQKSPIDSCVPGFLLTEMSSRPLTGTECQRIPQHEGGLNIAVRNVATLILLIKSYLSC